MTRLNRQSAFEAAAVVAGFTILTIAMTYPVVRVATTALPNDPGDPLLNAWILAWDSDRLLHGLRGLWDLPAFFPHQHTLAYTEHLLGIALLVAPINWATRNPILAYNVAFLLSFVVAGAGMYGLVRSLTGRRDAAWLAGLVYAFCPYRMSMLSHLQVLWSGWLAVTLWALHRYFTTGSRKAVVVCAAALLLQGLSNGYYLYFSLVPLSVIAAFEVSRAVHSIRKLVGAATLAVTIVTIVMAPVALAYSRERREQALVRSYEEIASYRADVGSYLHAPEAVRMWHWLPGPATLEGDLFPGGIAILLALAAVWRRERPRWTTAYLVVGILGFLLSLGPAPAVWGRELFPHAPYEWLMRSVPGFDGLRVPARFAVLVFLSLAVLVGFGAARLLDHVAARRRWLVATALSIAVLLEACVSPVPTVAIPAMTAGDRGAYLWLRDNPPGGVIEFPIQRPLSHSPLVYRTRESAGYLNALYQYRTLVHHHPIVNGHSGYEPLLNVLLRRMVEEHQIGDALLMLRSVGVRYVLVHPPGSSAQRLPSLTADDVAAEQQHDGEPIRLGETTAFRLKPWEPGSIDYGGTLHMVPTTAFHASASAALDRMPPPFDGDAGSRWLSVHPQTGHEWLRLDFDGPRRLARIDMDLGANFSNYPRRLTIDGTQRDGSLVRLFDGTVLPWYAPGLVRNPARAPIEIPLTHRAVTTILVRQTGQSASWHWSIHELRVWEEE